MTDNQDPIEWLKENAPDQYEEIMNRQKTATRRLYIGLGAVAALVGAFFLFKAVDQKGDPYALTGTNNASAKLAEELRAERLEREREAGLLAIKAKDAVRPILKDPDSAQFGQVFAGNVDGTACGTVSAKNSLGAYTGQTRFITALTPASSRVDDGSDAFSEQWDKLCAR